MSANIRSGMPVLTITNPCIGKLDKLHWSDGFTFASHGARIGVRSDDAEALERAKACLPPGSVAATADEVEQLYSIRVGRSKPGSHVKQYHLLYWGASRLARTMQLDEVFESLESAMHFSVAVMAKPQLFVHAGSVEWRGRAVVVPGRSLSGKTSLTAALVKAGATYLSDEYAVFDGEGRVHPYPKTLSIRGADGSAPRKVPAAELGGSSGTQPVPLGMVLMARYRAGAAFKPRALTSGEAVMGLLDNTVAARLRPEDSLVMLERAARDAGAIKTFRGEADDTAKQLLEMLDAKWG